MVGWSKPGGYGCNHVLQNTSSLLVMTLRLVRVFGLRGSSRERRSLLSDEDLVVDFPVVAELSDLNVKLVSIIDGLQKIQSGN